MITISDDKIVHITSDSGRLSCDHCIEVREDLSSMYDIDISKEVEKMLNAEEQIGYLPGMYNFSFTKKCLSIHHKDVKCEIKNTLNTILRKFVYEPNDSAHRMQATAEVKNYLDLMREKAAIYNFTIICDETNNTLEVLDRNEFMMRIGLKFSADVSDFTIFDIKISSESVPPEKGL